MMDNMREQEPKIADTLRRISLGAQAWSTEPSNRAESERSLTIFLSWLRLPVWFPEWLWLLSLSLPGKWTSGSL